MLVNPYTTAATSVTGRDQIANANTVREGSGFEQQLSAAIAESLQKLGVAAGELNISIKNAGTTATPQIVISYTPAAIENATTTRTNPFAGPDFSSAPAPAPTPVPTAPSGTPWSMWDGPADTRDTTPVGGGLLTASGSPRIELNEAPAVNQYNYNGPAARNPYFTTPSNPLREGYVLGFQNWFSEAFILGADAGPIPANKALYATEEGAQEALRIVRQFEPEAQLDQGLWGGGPFVASKQMQYISLPGGRLLSAGGLLDNYYNGGRGVSTESDAMLMRTLQMA